MMISTVNSTENVQLKFKVLENCKNTCKKSRINYTDWEITNAISLPLFLFPIKPLLFDKHIWLELLFDVCLTHILGAATLYPAGHQNTAMPQALN